MTELARKLNALVTVTRQQRTKDSQPPRAVREDGADYGLIADDSDNLFSPDDLAWLSAP